MGYYSDVKLITTKEGWKRIKQAVKQASPDNWKYVVGDSHTVPLCENKYVLLELEDIKWYDEFDEVRAFMQELHRFEAEHIPFDFMRIGEDNEDYECRYERDWKSNKYDDMPSLVLERKIEVEY